MSHVDTPTSLCRVGVARCDITPPVGIYHRMWGAATHERATGVHRPLTATALVLRPLGEADDPCESQVVVAIDLCLLWAKEMDALLGAIAAGTGIAADRINVAFSHTHGAGLMGLERAAFPGGELIAPFLADVGRKVAAIVKEACANPVPATITYGFGSCNLAAQRDFWDAGSGQFVCGYNPEAPADGTLLVARIQAGGGQCLATLVNYACHPTTLAWQNTLISPDFPGALRETVEQATGAPCVFLQGASGDLGPREGFVGDTRVADRNGRQLAFAVLSALEALPPPGTRFVYLGPVISGATLGAWEHQPLSPEALRDKAAWHWDRFPVPLHYRAGLPTREQTLADMAAWQAKKEEAQRAGDTAAIRDAHAMVERFTRRLTRIRYLPPGDTFPMPVTLGRIGDALWVFVEGELYQWFQINLRKRLPEMTVVVTTLTNGSRCSYLPTADAYGKGIYQESIAVLEHGCLETLLDRIVEEARARFAP